MTDQIRDDELAVEQTEGFKVGVKKTIDEYQQLDNNDESLRKWKESLGLGAQNLVADSSDPRTCIILSLGLEVEGRPDIVIDVSKAGELEKLKDKPFTIKEGSTFRMKVVKRMGVSSKSQEMIGSYGPNTTDKPEYEKKFEAETAPSGILARGHYTATSKFVDDDNTSHLQFSWTFDIKKDW